MMFVGEDAVATFAIESGFIVGESGESKESVGGDEVLPACEPVTAFQTVALSVKTITEMFGSDRVSQQDADARRSSLTTGWSWVRSSVSCGMPSPKRCWWRLERRHKGGWW
ncbi:hypothetical protein PC116_g18138 [Phytophthora cactorum]|nr:hypothetical protein PC116_g18138 [Phytophthora cactorum]